MDMHRGTRLLFCSLCFLFVCLLHLTFTFCCERVKVRYCLECFFSHSRHLTCVLFLRASQGQIICARCWFVFDSCSCVLSASKASAECLQSASRENCDKRAQNWLSLVPERVPERVHPDCFQRKQQHQRRIRWY